MSAQVKSYLGKRIVYLRHLALFILAGCLAGDFLKLMNEMGLIVKAAIKRNVN
jgi:hypothetical protein